MCQETYDLTGVGADAFNYNNLHTKAVSDGITITGDGTAGNPFVAVGGGLTCADLPICPIIISMANDIANKSDIGHTHTFASLTSKPTTLAGYGITDAYPLVGNPSAFIDATALLPYLTIASASATYQPILVSGTNIKTINGSSVLGAGDLTISGLPPQGGNNGKYLQTDGTNASWQNVSANVPINTILSATAAHTINNAAFQQEWKWDSLSSGIGLKLSSSSTTAASNTQTIFGVYQSGANNTSTQTTYGAIFSNTKTGTSSTNIAGRFVASGANNNYAIEADNQIKVVNSGTGVRSISFWSSSGENARIGCGYNNAGYDNLEINNLATTGNTAIVFKTKNTEVARFNDQGYFHIGSTTNPYYPLQIDAESAGFSVVTSHRILCNSKTELGFTTVNNGGIAHFGSVSGANTAVISTNGYPRMYITSTNVGIGTSSTPDASALLDLSSTTKGLSLPTMTATQASAIASPKKSLMIYVTDTNGTFTSAGWWGYNGTTWKLISAE